MVYRRIPIVISINWAIEQIPKVRVENKNSKFQNKKNAPKQAIYEMP